MVCLKEHHKTVSPILGQSPRNVNKEDESYDRGGVVSAPNEETKEEMSFWWKSHTRKDR